MAGTRLTSMKSMGLVEKVPSNLTKSTKSTLYLCYTPQKTTKENNMGIPQIIYLTINAIGLLLIAHLHGKPKTGEYNIFITLVSEGLAIALLWWGGFFG